MSELKPCPFCGDVDVHVTYMYIKDRKKYVECTACYCRGGWEPTYEKAIASWNNRPGEDKLQERIDALEWLIEVDEFCESSYYNELSADGEDELYAIHLAAHAAVEKK